MDTADDAEFLQKGMKARGGGGLDKSVSNRPMEMSLRWEESLVSAKTDDQNLRQ